MLASSPHLRLLRAVCLATTLALVACAEPSPDAALADYVQRLERTLGHAAPAATPDTLPRLPHRSELKLTLESGNLGTLDFLALTGCAVQVTIGKRNSSLGLMASASQRLLLELEFLQLAPECIDYQRSQGEDALADLLASAHAQKQRQLPALIFNATLGGPEYRALWRPPANLGPYPANTSSAPLTALANINASVRRWLAGDYHADNMAFEIQLSEVALGDGGALLRALALQQGWLTAGNAVLAAQRAEGPLCRGALRPAAADTLSTVIEKFFVGEVQPWSADLGRRQHDLLPLLQELEQLVASALPPAYRNWRGRRDASLSRWAAAPRQHVEALQAALEPCGGAGGRTGS
jgi:hypothetical protein